MTPKRPRDDPDQLANKVGTRICARAPLLLSPQPPGMPAPPRTLTSPRPDAPGFLLVRC
jgi:hypothetical protein